MATRKKYKIVLSEKYVRKSENGKEWLQFPVDVSGQLVAIQTIIPLDPYTEHDLEQVRKEAYEQGYHAGYAKYLNLSYEDGLKDIWEAARKIICEMDCEDLMKIFCGDNLDYIFALSPTTVIEKLKTYEQEQETIQVGDEVTTDFGKAVVVGVGPVHFEYVYADGCGDDKVKNAKKTGRHFPEIAEVLAKMKENK